MPIRLPLLAALAALIFCGSLIGAAVTIAKPATCSPECIQRVKERQFAARHGGCRTMACVARVRAKHTPRAIGLRMTTERGESWPCVDELIRRESRWRVTIANPNSQAYGLPQANPGSKMASEGADWRTSATTQLRWFFGYVLSRYKTCRAALEHHDTFNWY